MGGRNASKFWTKLDLLHMFDTMGKCGVISCGSVGGLQWYAMRGAWASQELWQTWWRQGDSCTFGTHLGIVKSWW